MLSKGFLSILLLGTALRLCNGKEDCYSTTSDLNSKWRSADVLEQLGHDVYQSLALGPLDAGDDQKRFVSVYGRALFQYLISKAPGEVAMIRDAVHKTNKQLDKPSDVLAAPMRAVISMMFNVVELPLTDVQQACPYDVREADCQLALTQLQAEKILRCPGYKYNIVAYNSAVAFVTSCGLQNLLEDLTVASSKRTDSDALDFFSDIASAKYPEAIRLFKTVFSVMNSIPADMRCDIFSFL
ncbi:unnamed protein product, partial [Iphiclides podalirius]